MLVFYRGGKDPISVGIRWETRGIYSHVGWMCDDGSMIEAWMKGGVQHNDSPFTLHGPETKLDVFSVRNLTAGDRQRVEAFLRNQCGAGYDWFGVVRFLDHINRNNYHRWFCSELVAEACEEAGRPLMMTEAWRLSPVSLSWSTELVPFQKDAGADWWEKHFARTLDVAPTHNDGWRPFCD